MKIGDARDRMTKMMRGVRVPLPPFLRRGDVGSDTADDKPHAPPVLLIHGLGVPDTVMQPIAWRLRRHGRRTINIGYNSRFQDIPSAAAHVARQVRDLGLREADAVVHSMGGILLRWAVNHYGMPRIRRAVLISSPNVGSCLANKLDRRWGWFFHGVFGEAFKQLRRDGLGIIERAGLLEGTEVGIIAGGSGTPRGVRNLFRIDGDCDGTVAVEETILPGMKDFVLLNHNHTSILFSSQTAHMTNLFLEHGVFRPRVAMSANTHDAAAAEHA